MCLIVAHDSHYIYQYVTNRLFSLFATIFDMLEHCFTPCQSGEDPALNVMKMRAPVLSVMQMRRVYAIFLRRLVSLTDAADFGLSAQSISSFDPPTVRGSEGRPLRASVPFIPPPFPRLTTNTDNNNGAYNDDHNYDISNDATVMVMVMIL